MEKYEGQLKDFKFKRRLKRSHHGKEKNVIYCDNIFTFDIETTSAWINSKGSVIKYKPGRSGDYWNNLKSLSLCYIWQFGVDDEVYYGRELRHFLNLLDDIPKDMKCFIWVHNLSFEMHFLQDIFDEMEMFARMPHKPMKLVSQLYDNIEWRCTYMLTRLSLDSWGKSLGIPKKTGDLDYRKIRTPQTKLTPKELGYCERDCIVVYHGIKDYLKRYETQEKIPLTQTGTVRRVVKKMLLSDPVYHKWIKKLVPHNAKEYKMLQTIFAGGYTHANRLHAGVVQEGIIEHYDFSSHYPTMLCAFKYPCSPWAYLGKYMPKKLDFENNAYIFHLRFRNIETVTFNTYIQAVKAACKPCKYLDKQNDKCRKCKWASVLNDNGRIVRASELDIWVTEQDYLTIKETYRWKSMECLAVYKSRKDYLPTPFIKYVLELYGNKTTLKDVKGQEALYTQSKQYINSLFGMMVTALMQADVTYDNDTKEWGIDKLTEVEVNERLAELRNWSPRERRYFLSYSWGCWCTAYARRCLWMCLQKPSNGLGERDVLYCDTDSIFINGSADFSWYNEWIIQKLDTAMKCHGIDPEATRPEDPKGRKRQLGIFAKEDTAQQFLTLGAKRYIERRGDGKLYLTVSGINKDAVYCLHDDITNFKDGFIFDKDFPTVHKSLLTYVYEQPEITYPDGYRSTYKYGICLRPNGYHLHMSEDYKNLINYKLDMTSLPDAFKNHIRGRFTVEA